MPLTVEGEKWVLPVLLGGTRAARTVYVGLLSGEAEDVSTRPELNGGAYARAATAAAVWGTVDGATGSQANSAAIAFPQATADWTAYTAFALYDAANGGNMLAYGEFNGSKVVASGTTEILPIGALVFDFDNT